MTRIHCRICERLFPPAHPSTRLCSARCIYISDMLCSRHGKTLNRKEAIKHYGGIYDDPLRLYCHSKYTPAIRAIQEFCRDREDDTFSVEEINSHCDVTINAKILSVIQKKFGIVQRVKRKLWRWTLPEKA